MILGAQHSHLVEPQRLVCLRESAVLNDEAIPPVSVGLGPFHREAVSSLHLYYYLVILLLLLNDLDGQVFLAVQVRVHLHLAILSMTLVHFGIISTHRLVELSRENVVLVLKLDCAMVRVNRNRESRRRVQVS